jgi:hypothetical protein
MGSGVRGFFLLGAIVAACASTNAAELKEARVTQIIRDVKLLPNAAPARPAVVNDPVRNGTAVRTGIESRTELIFTDATLARLGANTIFSFSEGTRNLELTDGAMLLRVPKNAGGAKINTAAVTAAITGTTVMLEFHKNSYIKFIVLEGTGRVFLPSRVGESVLVHAGQMLITKPDAKNLPNPVDVDIRQLRKTSRLIRGFGKMGSEDLIAQTEADQDEERAEGELYETNLAIYGGGTSIILNDPEHIQETHIVAEQNPPPTPVPPPVPPPVVPPVVASEFGPPETITSPNPYPLGADTQLTTAGPPKVVSNSTTNYGKIYRNTPLDGIRSLWFFRTTRPFDIASGFDTPDRSLFDLNNIAVFKFQNLQLVTNPTISVPNGITKLGLVGVDGISSASSGGTLTFGGLNSVLLATQNGSIVLSGGISFQNIPNLFFYARGDSVALNLASPISGSSNLLLNSEGTVQVNGNVTVDNFNAFSNGDFLQGSGIVTAHEISISSLGANVVFDWSKFPDLRTGGGTIDLRAANTLTVIPDLSSERTTRGSFTAAASIIQFLGNHQFQFDTNNSSPVFQAGLDIRAANVEFVGPRLTLNAGRDITVAGTQLFVRKDGQLDLSGSITAGGSISARYSLQSASIAAGQNIIAGNSIYAASITAGGDVRANGNIVTFGGTITAGNNIRAAGITSEQVNAGHDIIIDNSRGSGRGLFVNQLESAGTLTLTNVPIVSAADGDGGLFQLAIDCASISTHGPAIPLLAANGVSADGSGALPGDGGIIELTIRNGGLSVSSNGTFRSVSANGGSSNISAPFDGGNGGSVDITAAGPILVSSPIEATTGYLPAASSAHGNGGSVSLTSDDSVTVNSRIEVSSNDPVSNRSRRRSARGGNITLTSHKPAGVAINITNSSQLLSLLDAAAPGPGGKVTILASGASSVANVNGKIVADRGTIDIRHTGESGQIVLGGLGEGDRIDAHADVIKVAALGNNGVLTIGNGLLSADTTLKLYSLGNGGTINFVADVTLAGASTKIIAGDTVNIFNGVTVTIGGTNPASVFTNHANYSGFGGNGTRLGTFDGRGANNPLPLTQAPSFDGPGG